MLRDALAMGKEPELKGLSISFTILLILIACLGKPTLQIVQK